MGQSGKRPKEGRWLPAQSDFCSPPTGGDTVHKDMPDDLAKALTAAFIETNAELLAKTPWAAGNHYGKIDNETMGICNAGIKLHPGALVTWEEAGFEVPDCAKP